MLDAVAVLLLRCAETGRTFWAWSEAEWIDLLGRTSTSSAGRPGLGRTTSAPLPGRTCLSARRIPRVPPARQLPAPDPVLAHLRARPCRRRDRPDPRGAGRVGLQAGRDDDTLLPMVVCQVFLLNGSPHLEELTTGLFDRIRAEKILPGSQGNTLFAMQRAVAALGFCDPRSGYGRPLHPGRRRPADLAAVGGPLACHLHPDPQGPRQHSAPICSRSAGGCRRASRGRRPGSLDPADLRGVGRGAGPDEVGDYVQRTVGLRDKLGKPLQAPTKAADLRAVAGSSGTARNGSGCPGASTPTGCWPPRAASPRCSARTRA